MNRERLFRGMLVVPALLALMVGMIGGSGTALAATWTPMTSGTTDDIVDVCGISSSNAFAVTVGGALIHYDGSSWSPFDPGPFASLDGEYNYHVHGIWGTSASNLWVVGFSYHVDGGWGSSVFRYDGRDWTTSTIGPGDTYFQDIWGSSTSDIFVAQAEGPILHYDGSQWSDMDVGATGYLGNVWGISATDVFAVGVNGTVAHYDGSAWSEMVSNSISILHGTWGSSASDVFAVGRLDDEPTGHILHYTGGVWSDAYLGTGGDTLNSTWGSSSSNVFAVGTGGTILHYDGNSWSPWASGTTKNLNAIWGTASAGFFAVGEGGTILHYDDYPDRPVNVSPADGATAVTLTPTLQGSAYADADGDAHVASRWQIRSTAGDYNSPVWDSHDSAPANSITVPAGELASSTTYYWRVGYQQAGGRYSSYSKETSFTTSGSDPGSPNQPVNISPADAAQDVNLTPTLKSSTFVDPDDGQHAASQWQVTTTSGSYAGALFDSGTDAVNLTQTTLPPATLSSSARYYWHVRHRDSSGNWSEWSRETAFNTLSGPTSPAGVRTAEASNINTDSARLNGELLSLGTASGVSVSFQWGAAPLSYTNETRLEVRNSPGAFVWDLRGLSAGTTVYYRSKVVGDGTVFGNEMSFTTGSAPLSSPSVVTDNASGITASSAQLNGDLTSLGTAQSVTVSFLWGFTKGGPYPNETTPAARTEAGSFDFSLSGLASGVTFYCQAKAVGDGTSYGAEESFTITGREPGIITLTGGQGRPGESLTVSITGANLNGATDVNFGRGVWVSGMNVDSASRITVRIAIEDGAEPGARDVTVTTPYGTARAAGLFMVNEAVGRAHLWVYLAAGAAGIVVLGIVASLGVWILRRRSRPLVTS